MTAIPNVSGPVGLRAMCFKDGRDESFESPAFPVRWESSGLLSAACQRGCTEVPGDRCRCGIYAALFPWLAKQYLRGQGSALFLIEGCGKVRIPTVNLRGFRAQQAFVIAAVVEGDPQRLTGRDLTAYYGAQYFGAPVITLDEAVEMIRAQWESLGHHMPPDKGGE